jgi:uncharacterized protein (DUF885 family)
MGNMKTCFGRTLFVLAVVLMGVLVGACSTDQTADLPPIESPAQLTAQPTSQPTTPLPLATDPAPAEQSAIQPTATAPPAIQAAGAESSVTDIVTSLEGLAIDEFFERSYEQLLLRDPEELTALGLAESFGLRNDRLTDLSETYVRETQELEAAILDQLRTYDRAALTPEQRTSYDVYEWYLDDLVRGHEFTYYDYPFHHFVGTYQDELVRLLTELHPLADWQNAEDYVSRLSLVDDQVDQLLAGLKVREETGVIPPSFIIELTRRQMVQYLQMRTPDPAAIEADSLSVYTVFRDKLAEIDALSAEEKQTLLDAALAAVEESFIPAYVALLDYLEYLAPMATDDAGVWKFPDGDTYYAYILRNQTSTDLTPEEIHELGRSEVARIQAEMRQVFDELGYPQDESLGALMDRAVSDGGVYDMRTPEGKEQVIKAYEAILDEVDQKLDVAFDIRPGADVIVVGDPESYGPAYYVSPSMDGSRPGAFHTGIAGSWAPKFNMPTVAYHEAIPGHHYQIAIAGGLDLPTFRNIVFFNGYGEGWALYAERLAWEMGLYDDDPYGNLGRLQLELLRGVRLVADTGIHAMHWTREEAKAYMNEALGDPSGGWATEVERYVVLPAQATGYKVGMLKILELRQRAVDQLGDQFDLKEFHNVVLSNGSMPLEILERVVQDYIDAKLGGVKAVSARDGMVQGWAVLAEKDDYSDVDMTDLPVGYIGVTQMRQLLEDSDWEPDHIHEVREFDREALQHHVDWLAENADEDDIVFLYVAAHGRYLSDVVAWHDFFSGEWEQIASQRRLLVVDACQAENLTSAVSDDPAAYLSIAAVAAGEYGWSGLEEEGLPIIGGVFTHYFAAAFGDAGADADGDGFVSAQEAARMAEAQQRDYMHNVVFAVPEFVQMYRSAGAFPDKDPDFPHVIVDDTIGEPLYLALEAYP